MSLSHYTTHEEDILRFETTTSMAVISNLQVYCLEICIKRTAAGSKLQANGTGSIQHRQINRRTEFDPGPDFPTHSKSKPPLDPTDPCEPKPFPRLLF